MSTLNDLPAASIYGTSFLVCPSQSLMCPPLTPFGLKPAPRHAPTSLATDTDLRSLQRLMLHALVQPLQPNDDLQPLWRDGRPMAEVVAEFIKPNDRLTALERLQIYSRSYWFRLIDCIYDDAPGLRALLGEKKFSALVRAYLAKYPSRSFTLRNLASRLAQFIQEEPRLRRRTRRWRTPLRGSSGHRRSLLTVRRSRY